MKKIYWGLIGLGDIAQSRVAPAINSIENAELVAVSRRNKQLGNIFAKRFGAKYFYSDWKDLVKNKEIDAVYIATPVSLHAEQTIMAAKNGKHVLCEKPMAISSTESKSMIDSCNKSNVKLGIAYYRHFYPAINRIKQIIEQGDIGIPIIAQINAFLNFNPKQGEPRYWLLEKEKSGGGPMMDFGCHRLEIMNNLFGAAKRVEGNVDLLHYKRKIDDTGFVSCLYEKGVLGIITVCHAAHENQDTLDIYGSKGSIHVSSLEAGEVLIKNGNVEKTETHANHKNVHLPYIKDFCDCIVNNRNPTVDGTTGREITRILDIIYKRI
jgi:predicted dehydrogenase